MANVYCWSGATGTGSGASWANAYTVLQTAVTAAGVGGTVYLASDHSELYSGATTLTMGGTVALPVRVLSISRATSGTNTPADTDLLAGALIGTNAASISLTIRDQSYWNGVEVRMGSGQTTTCSLIFGSGGGQAMCMENGKINLASTGGASRFQLNNNCTVQLINTPLRLGIAAAGINLNAGRLFWHDTPTAIDLSSSGVAPTALIATFGAASILQMERNDFNNLNAANQLFGTANVIACGVSIKDCKFGPNFTPGNWSTIDGGSGFISRSGSSTFDDNSVTVFDGPLATLHDRVIYRTGGASADGTTPYSWRFTPTTQNNWFYKARGPDIEQYSTLTGSGHTATMYGVSNSAAMLFNDDVSLEASALLDSASPLKTQVSSTKATPLTTNAALTADTSAWDGGVTARSNGATGIAVGDVRKVASNPGRIFFCTTAGNCGSAEPAGYATAIDGGTVNESTGGTGGTAVFRAGWRFKMSVTLGTINRAGLIVARPVFGLATATNVWIDPDVVVA